jgi:hypothetical protein
MIAAVVKREAAETTWLVTEAEAAGKGSFSAAMSLLIEDGERDATSIMLLDEIVPSVEREEEEKTSLIFFFMGTSGSPSETEVGGGKGEVEFRSDIEERNKSSAGEGAHDYNFELL